MDLYYMPASATCRAVVMVANGLGIELNKILKDSSAGETLEPEFIKINPQHTIPTLVDNGFAIWESRAIIIYLVETYDKTHLLYPECIKQRALINQRLFFDMALTQAFGDYFFKPLLRNEPADPELFKNLDSTLMVLNTFLEGQAYIGGDNFTVADIALLATVSTIGGVGFDLSKYSNVTRWFESVKKVAPGWDEMLSGISDLKQIIKKMKESREK